MEWYVTLVVILGPLFILMLAGLPVAFAFFAVNLVGAYILMGGTAGIEQLILNTVDSISTFTLIPIALFMIMGEAMFQSRIAVDLMDTLDKWFGKLRGRLALMAVGGGVLFSTLTGNSMGSIALLGSSLTPEMEKRGYKKQMSLGPILGSSGLAIMIPPSSLAVVLGVIAEISIGQILIGIIVPGLLMALLYVIYIVGRCTINPELAPTFEVEPVPFSEKISSTVINIVPLSVVVFSVCRGHLPWHRDAERSCCDRGFRHAFAGPGQAPPDAEDIRQDDAGQLEHLGHGPSDSSRVPSHSPSFWPLPGRPTTWWTRVLSLDVSPSMIVIPDDHAHRAHGHVHGSLCRSCSSRLPIFVPIVIQLGFDPIWFAALLLVAIETGATSPPFGAALFVMKAVAPPGTTMGDIYRAARSLHHS